MKNINLILSMMLAFGLSFSGCKKDDPDPDPVIPACTNVISQEVEIYDDGANVDTTTKVYIYNANKKLVKITYAYNSNPVSNFDTIAYNASGEITTVKKYSVGNPTPFETNTYTYTSGRITSVIEEGNNGAPYNRTRTFTYNGSGVLTDQDVVYNSGSSSGDGPENINSIVFTGGNPTAADLGFSFGGTVTLEYDLTASNPYLGLNNDAEDILKMFPANNVTTAFPDASPGTPFFTRSYTYANGRVSTITETDGGGGSTTTTITYACI
jgi:hypothetical protein